MGEKKEGQLYQEVVLQNVRFFAFHGFYDEEQILGNEFWVTAKLSFVPMPNAPEKFVDYENLYKILKQSMSKTERLLESVLQNILVAIRSEYEFVDAIKIEIRKSNPPFGGDFAEACVSLTWNV